jgi:hypothetical protein
MKPFDSDAQFLGETLLKAIHSLPQFTQKNLFKVLEEVGIPNLAADAWYAIQALDNFYRQIEEKFGPNTLFDMGKAIPENAKFPPGINTIDDSLQLTDMAYNMNHKGYVGFHKLLSHDRDNKKIIIHSHTPYPADFDRGMFTAIARGFKTGVKVTVDESRADEKKDEKERWYIITYR